MTVSIAMRSVRLGDDIDDFCVKCKRVMNHSVVSIVSDLPAKVRCRTCHNDHDYRNEQPPPPKVDNRKAALFNQVLGNVTGAPPAAQPEAKTASAAVADGIPNEPKAAVAKVAKASAAKAVAEKPKARKKSKA